MFRIRIIPINVIHIQSVMTFPRLQTFVFAAFFVVSVVITAPCHVWGQDQPKSEQPENSEASPKPDELQPGPPPPATTGEAEQREQPTPPPGGPAPDENRRERRGPQDRPGGADRAGSQDRGGRRGFEGPPAPPAPEPVGDKKIRFNIRMQPWKDVIEWFAEQADLSLMMKTYPQGTFNYKDDQYFTPDEAIDKLNQFLLLEEFTLIRKDKMLIVYDLGPSGGFGIPEQLVQTVFPEDLAKRGSYEIVKCQFDLKRTTPEIVQNEIERILGPQGSVAMMPQSQTILITETVSNLRAIQKVIERLDSVDQTLKSYELKNLSAEEGLAIMRNLMGLMPDDQTLRVVSDMSGKKIWLSGRTDRIEKALEILTKIDDAYIEVKTEIGDLQFKVFPVDTADLSTVLAVCQTLLAGKPGVRLSVDQNTNSLVAYAYLDDMRVIKTTLETMQADSYGNHVIRLAKLTTANASTAIEKFFGADSGSSAKAPVVETDATNKQLYVRCTSSQLKEIKSLLANMGETFEPTNLRSDGDPSKPRTIRNINISPSAAALILDQIQQVWPQGHDNEIKIVKPSAIGPAMKSDDVMTGSQRRDVIQRVGPGEQFGPGGFQQPGRPGPRFAPPPRDSNDVQIDQLLDNLLYDENDEIEFDNPSTWNHTGANAVYRPVQMVRYVDDEPKLTPEQQALQDRLQQMQQQQMRNKPGQPEGLAPDALDYLRGVNPNKGTPVVLSIGPAGLVLASDDTEALDALEDLIEAMSNEAILTTPVLKPYYLQYVSADSASSTLNRLMDTSSSSSSDSPVEDFGGAALFSVVGSLGPIQSTGDVSITADSRLNVIYVKANPVDHYTIEKKLLPLLDRGEGPEEVKREASPRMIPLKNMQADDAMELVKSAFADKMQTQGGAARGGQQGGFGGQQGGGPGGMPGLNPEMLQQMMQRMQGGGRGGRGTTEEEEKMTLSVIKANNVLVVTASEVLFERVKRFVEEIDAMSGELDIVTEFVDIKNVNPQLLPSMLGKVVGSDMIQTSGQSTQPRGATMALTTGSTIQTGIGGTGTGRGGGFGGFGGAPGGGGFGGFGGAPGGGFGGLMNIFGGGARPGGMGGGPTFGGGMPGGGMPGGQGGQPRQTFGAPGGGGGGRGGR